MTMQVSIKGVVFKNDCLLLLLNDRNEYELPGGRPDPSETGEETLRRELFEETGLNCDVSEYLGSQSFEVIPNRWVFIVGFHCICSHYDLEISHEHIKAEWWPINELEKANLAKPYRALVQTAINLNNSPLN